jgi:hypothetical protein
VSDSFEPVLIGEAFPADDLAAQWVVEWSMAMNDLITLDGHIHDALNASRPEAPYYLRLLCGVLRELWRLFDVADNEPEVMQLIDDFETKACEAYTEVRELFVRLPATEEDPKPLSWGERYLKDVRDRTFHYFHVGSDELSEALTAAARHQARVIEEARKEGRLFDFADVVANNAAFGDIDQPELRDRFYEILETAKRIITLLVPVTWNALGIHLRRHGIDPLRLWAPTPEEPSEDT